MNKEAYFWIGVLVVAIAVGLYIRLYYSPQINPQLKFNATGVNTSLYPFQRLSVPLEIVNSGSSIIRNMSVEVTINGNASIFYRVTIPAGKSVVVYFNNTFSSPGKYTLLAVADPAHVKNIADRAAAQNNVNITVKTPESGDAFATLPSEGLEKIMSVDLERNGYLLLSYLDANYSLGIFNYTPDRQLSNILMPLLNMTIGYISNISIASGKYGNGTSVYSLWISGYLKPSAVSAAASALGLTPTHVSVNGTNVTVVKVANDTLCSWYSGGLNKIAAYESGGNCTALVANNNTNLLNRRNSDIYGMYLKLNPNESYIGNYSEMSNNSQLFYRLSEMDGAIVATAVGNNRNYSPLCFGATTSYGNDSYCTTYLFQKSGLLSAISLVRTTLLTQQYNISVFYLTNESKMLSFAPVSTSMIMALNISHSLKFASGFVNTCSFESSFSCSKPSFNNGNVSFSLTNIAENATINSVYCFEVHKGAASRINAALKRNGSMLVTAMCYNGTTVLSGLPLDLHLNLTVNYTVNNSIKYENGTAVIYGLSG